MANNFLWNVGAALRGQQEYDALQQQKELTQQQVEAGRARLDEIKDATAAAKKQKERQGTVDEQYLKFLADNGQLPPGIAPPPPGAGAPTPDMPQPPPVQAPAPGQQSQPMMRAPIGPDAGLDAGPQGMPPPPPGAGMPGPVQGGPPGPPQGPQGAPPGQPGIPPYQTVGGPPGGAPGPAQAMGIPPPPQQPGPRPGSLTLADAARYIKAQGITDPATGVQILDKLAPYLNNEAKMEAAQYKLQAEFDFKSRQLEEKGREADQISKDKKYSADQRADAAKQANEIRQQIGLLNASLRQQSNSLRAKEIEQKAGAGNAISTDDANLIAEQVRAGDSTVMQGFGRNPAALAKIRAAITEQSKAAGETGKDLALAKAGFEGVKAGERALGTRTAQVGLAGNEAALFAKNALDASNKVNRTEFPSLNSVLEAGRKGTGNKDVVALASYTNSLINAYARAVNPSGSPTVSDKEHAREILSTAFSKGQYETAIKVILNEIDAAKASPGATKDELRGLFKNEKHGLPDTKAAPAGAGGLKLPTSKTDLKAGQIYQTARGPARWNGSAFEAQ